MVAIGSCDHEQKGGTGGSHAIFVRAVGRPRQQAHPTSSPISYASLLVGIPIEHVLRRYPAKRRYRSGTTQKERRLPMARP